MVKLQQLLEELQLETTPSQEVQKPTLSPEQKKKLSEMVSQYNEYGKSIYRESNLLDVAKNLQEVCQLAETYALTEAGDWFEQSTIKRNMQELRKYGESFAKIAPKIHQQQQQIEALYEDMGKVLQRYFEIKDVIPTAQSVNKMQAPLQDPRTVNVANVDEAQAVNPIEVEDRMSPSIRDPRVINPVTQKKI